MYSATQLGLFGSLHVPEENVKPGAHVCSLCRQAGLPHAGPSGCHSLEAGGLVLQPACTSHLQG